MVDKPLTPAEKVQRAFVDLEPYTLHVGEVLVERIEDDSGGQVARIRFHEDQHPLRELILTDDGHQHARIVQMLIIETDDAGNPIHQARRFQLANASVKGGELCKRFHTLKGLTDFHRWLWQHQGMTELAAMTKQERREATEEMLRATLFPDGQSSKFLDHDPALRDKFLTTFWRPFRAWEDERYPNRSREGTA